MGLKALRRSIFSFYDEYKRFTISDKAATLAFRSLFAFAPMLILVISVTRFFVSGSGVEEGLLFFLTNQFGPAAEDFFDRLLRETASGTVNALVAFVGFGLVVYGVSGFVLSLQSSFFNIFSVKLNGEPMRQTVAFYTLSIVYLVAFLFFVGVFFLARFFVDAGLGLVESLTPIDVGIFWSRFITDAVLLAITSSFFAATYRLFSLNRVSWKDAFTGSLFAGIALVILNNLLGLYFALSSAAFLYGAAGFLVALLFWLYYFSLIILLGALVACMMSKNDAAEGVQ